MSLVLSLNRTEGFLTIVKVWYEKETMNNDVYLFGRIKMNKSNESEQTKFIRSYDYETAEKYWHNMLIYIFWQI